MVRSVQKGQSSDRVLRAVMDSSRAALRTLSYSTHKQREGLLQGGTVFIEYSVIAFQLNERAPRTGAMPTLFLQRYVGVQNSRTASLSKIST